MTTEIEEVVYEREDTPWERGRPARILSLRLALSFPAMRQPVALPEGTAWARPKQNHGSVAGRSGSRRWARLREDLCGRDARAPGGASSHDLVIPREQNCRSIPGPLVVEGGPSVFVFIGGSSSRRSAVSSSKGPHSRAGAALV